MQFKLMVFIFFLLTVAAEVIFLPVIIHSLRANTETIFMLHHPDKTFSDFSKCQRQVDDTEHCYDTYNAAVQLAEAEDCTPSGIEQKRKFKKLVEHTTEANIESELEKECPDR